jgi:hypothetical protein
LQQGILKDEKENSSKKEKDENEIAIKKLHYMPGLDDTQFKNEFNNIVRA